MINLFFIDYYSQDNGGLTTYVKELTSRLRTVKEINLTMILVKATHCRYIEFRKVDQRNCYLIPHDISSLHNTNNDVGLADYLKNEIGSLPNILFHFNWINHAPFAQFLKSRMPCKVILTKHCMPWRDAITGNYPFFKLVDSQLNTDGKFQYLYTPLMRELLSYISVDHIVCVTSFAQSSLQRIFGIPSEKTSVIYNGLALKRGYNKKTALRKKYGFSLDEQIILYAGNLNERKGVGDLIAAFDILSSKLQSIRLVIAGNGDFNKVLKRTVKGWSRITFTGNLEQKKLVDFYKMADIGIVPSYIEQCSYTAIEMMHSKLPIIVADVDGLREIVPNNAGLKVPVHLGKHRASVDQKKLSEAMYSMLTDADLAQGMAERAKVFAQSNLLAENMTVETVNLYKRMINTADVVQKQFVMREEVLVSVVLPCYNAELYVESCINSVLNQTYRNFELIIIDDGSTDETIKIINNFNDNRIKLYRNEANYGITTSLNKALALSKGKYIARIDADDMMHPERISKQVQFLEAPENSQIMLVGSHHYVINKEGILVSFKQYPISDHEIRSVYAFQNPFSHPTTMMRTDIVKPIGYSDQYPHVEDYHLWGQILRQFKVANIPEYLTYYRVHEQNTSKENDKIQRENAASVMHDELDYLGIEPTVEELKVHLALAQGLGRRYFNDKNKIDKLRAWIDKVCASHRSTYKLPQRQHKATKDYVLRNICNIY